MCAHVFVVMCVYVCVCVCVFVCALNTCAFAYVIAYVCVHAACLCVRILQVAWHMLAQLNKLPNKVTLAFSILSNSIQLLVAYSDLRS